MVAYSNDEAIDTFEKILKLDPEYKEALNWLAYRYSQKGDVPRAIEMMKRYQTLLPGEANPFDSMGEIYLSHGMLDEVIPCFENALSLKSDANGSAANLASIYYLKEDYAKALQWSDSAIARSRTLGVPHIVGKMRKRVRYLLWMGRVNDAQSLLEKGLALRSKSGQAPTGEDGYLEAWIAFERGKLGESRLLLEMWRAWLASSQRDTRLRLGSPFYVGMIDVKEGQLDSLRTRLSQMDAIRREAAASDSASLDGKMALELFDREISVLSSELLLAEGKVAEALDATPKRSLHDMASRPMPLNYIKLRFWRGFHSAPNQFPIPVMVDVLPRAYLAVGNIDSAIAAYERAVDPKIDPICPSFPRYHYRLALLYERKGLKAKAISEYEKFLTIWGKADPIYKEPADARAKLAKLKRG
jgi:tetratricopeptide (TPR) repeat protein